MSDRHKNNMGAQCGAKPTEKADTWRDFESKFRQLAVAEERVKQHEPIGVHGNFEEHPEVLEEGKHGVGHFSLLRVPPHGVWEYRKGVSADIVVQFRALAARAGCALGWTQDNGSSPEHFWLYRLFFYLLDTRKLNRDHKRKLFGASSKGGLMLYVCTSSATFCAELERQALESSTDVLEHDTALAPTKRKSRNGTEKVSRPPLAATERRAKTVAKLLGELRTIKPKMHNESRYLDVKREYPGYLIFKIAQSDSDVKRWIENVQDRRGLVGLAQEIAARHHKASPTTVKTDWSHRRNPRRKSSRV